MTALDPAGITIRTATDDEFPALFDVLAAAFGDTISPDEMEFERAIAEMDRTLGAFDGTTPVGMSSAYSFRLTIPGGEVGAAGVTLVGVLPTHVRRGILRSMMTRLLDQAVERGEPIAILGATEAAIYQRFGYGMATQQSSFEAPATRIRFLDPVETSGRIRLVDAEEAAGIFPSIYDVRRQAIIGAVGRSETKWRRQMLYDADWMRGSMGAKVRAVLEVDGEARAYTIYRMKPDWDATGPRNTITVLEVTGLDVESEQVLWQWLFGIDLVSTVKAMRQPVPHPLQLMVTEPRRLGMGLNDGAWLRILDIGAALEARSYRAAGSLVFEVTDTYRPSNAGRWQLTVPGQGSAAGRASVTSTSAEPDLALDISALASTYLGTFRFSDLARARRVRECRPGALTLADELFATNSAPWNTTPF